MKGQNYKFRLTGNHKIDMSCKGSSPEDCYRVLGDARCSMDIEISAINEQVATDKSVEIFFDTFGTPAKGIQLKEGNTG